MSSKKNLSGLAVKTLAAVFTAICLAQSAAQTNTATAQTAKSPAPAAAKSNEKSAGAGAQKTAVDRTKFHALLVGCTKYDNLKPNRSLQGPANDVELMRKFFIDQLQLDKKTIAVLSEPEAARGQQFRPTRENIEREIQNLIATAREGDQIVLLLAGHGGQQPERKDPDPTYLKPDGLDQMFLPCDCGQWNGKKGCVERAIVDYELRNWCKQITAKKARLWVILDCCCSGWTLRGNSAEVSRNLDADDLGIPDEAITAAQQAAAARPQSPKDKQQTRGGADEGQNTKPAAFNFGPQSPDYVGLYAAQRDESELEMPMPPGDVSPNEQKPQGLLTYAVVEILSRTSQRITYAELANLVRERYPQWGRTTGPTPVVEGLGQSAGVLGTKRSLDHSFDRSSGLLRGISLARWQKSDDGKLTLNEGQLQGLTPGSIVALYPSIDRANAMNLLSYAQVIDAALMQSTIKLVKFNEVKELRKSALPERGRFEVVRLDFGSLRAKLGVDMQPIDGDAVDGNTPAAEKAKIEQLRVLAAELKHACSQEESICEFADRTDDARWLVQWRNGKLVLISRDAAQIRGELPAGSAAFAVPENQPAAEIMRDMARIARAQNLLNLTAAQQVAAISDASTKAMQDDFLQPNVELKMLRFQNRNDANPTEIDLTKGPLELVPGDYVGWRMTNLGKCDVAVSLLYVDAGFGIKAVFPRAGAGTDNMLTKNRGTFTTRPAKITANPAGGEHVVLIAVPRRPQQQSPDFSCLEQETLVQARGGEDENPSLQSPLGRLLQNAMYGHGGTRGLDTGDMAESQLSLLSWRVLPEKSP